VALRIRGEMTAVDDIAVGAHSGGADAVAVTFAAVHAGAGEADIVLEQMAQLSGGLTTGLTLERRRLAEGRLMTAVG
jgi:hypothetical protein